MVIGLLILTSIPTTTGVAFGVSEQRKANQRKEDARRMAKFNIDVECDGDTDDDRDVNGRRLVVRNDKVYLDHPNPADRSTPAFTALAFYIEYPELDETKHLDRGLGLPTYVSANPPLLNWIYADVNTHEMKYGNRSQSVAHIVGPWDWTEDEKVITLEESSRFVAVEEEEGEWALYFDGDGDECGAILEERGMLDRAFVPVRLVRRPAEEEEEEEPGSSGAQQGSAGQQSQGQHSQGQHSQGQHSQGQHSQGQHSQGQHSQGQHSQGQHSQGQHSQGQHSQGQHSQGQHSQGQHSQGQHSQGQHSQGQHSQGTKEAG